jgi:hypothetical protein
MNKLVALVGIALIAGSAVAADVQKIVIAKAEVKVAAKVAAPAPAQNPKLDSRFDNARLESFSCCGLPQ